MEYFNRLPVEITLDILTRVPTESVLECKLVSKSWNNLISRHPLFSKMHLHRLSHPDSTADDDSGKCIYIALTEKGRFYYFEYNDNHGSEAPIERIRRINLPPPWNKTTFVGSYHGLICLGQPYHYPERNCICNPITRECVMLPQCIRDSKMHLGYYWTSGYVSSTNEYKVVRIYAPARLVDAHIYTLGSCSIQVFVDVYIYTLGSGSGWRYIGKFNSPFRRYYWYQAGIFANGSLYWLDTELRMIVTFDLVEEKFRENLSPPILPQGSNWATHRLGVLDGFLYFAIRLVVEDAEYYDIWLLKKKEREAQQSWGWTKEFRINDLGQLLANTKSNGVLTYIHHFLNICDTKASTSKRLVDFKEWVGYVFPHKNTLVSLRELGEEDTKKTESIEIEEIESHDQPCIQLQEDETLYSYL